MCCLFGIIDYEKRLRSKTIEYITSVLSNECEVRGTDATGISYINHGSISVYKRPKPAHSMKFRIPRNCHVIMGHTRLTTQGNEKFNRNNHPFLGYVHNTSFALAHNGILHNDKQLRRSEKLPKTRIETDSYIAVQLIEKQRTLDFNSLKLMAEKVKGSFSFTVLDSQRNLYFIKGDNPLCIYKFSRAGFYLYASTKEILEKTITLLGLQGYRHEEVKITGGDILRIDPCGHEDKERFDFTCSSTHGYFRRTYQSYYGKICEYDYWVELKSVAHYFGYSEEDIDNLKRYGYSPEDVEELLYYGKVTDADNI